MAAQGEKWRSRGSWGCRTCAAVVVALLGLLRGVLRELCVLRMLRVLPVVRHALARRRRRALGAGAAAWPWQGHSATAPPCASTSRTLPS